MRKKTPFKMLSVAILVTLLMISASLLTLQTPEAYTSGESYVSLISETQIDFLGAMHGGALISILFGPQGDQVMQKIENEGMAGLYRDSALLSQAKNAFEQEIKLGGPIAASVGAHFIRSIPAVFSWCIVEPEQGSFHFDFPDIIVTEAQKQDLELVATFRPYTPWDLVGVEPDPTGPLDAIFWSYKAGPPQNMEAFTAY